MEREARRKENGYANRRRRGRNRARNSTSAGRMDSRNLCEADARRRSGYLPRDAQGPVVLQRNIRNAPAALGNYALDRTPAAG